MADPETDSPEKWGESLITWIGRRAAITYAINEIIKGNVKTTHTEATIVYLKGQQLACNQAIKAVLYTLQTGRRSK